MCGRVIRCVTRGDKVCDMGWYGLERGDNVCDRG